MVKWTPKSRQRIGSFKEDLSQPAMAVTIVMPHGGPR